MAGTRRADSHAMVPSPLHADWLRQKQFLFFDGLRALSILAVMVFHYAPRFGMETPLTHGGHEGVDLFFVLSGFLITTLLIREKQAYGRIDLGSFYARRILRIFPLYYTVLLAHLALVLFVLKDSHPQESAQFLHNLKYFLTYTSNWFVGRNEETRTIFYIAWSLASEEQFYLFWPPILFLCAGLARPMALMAGLLAVSQAFSLFAGELQLHLPGLLVKIISSVPPSICLGVLASLILHSEAGARWFNLLSRKATVLLALPMLAAAYLLYSHGFLPRLALIGAMTLSVASLATNTPHGSQALLTNRLAQSVGRISYGLYLYHMLPLNAVLLVPFIRQMPGWVGFLLAMLASYGVAWLSFQYYEMFFLRYKKKFSREPSVAAAGPGAGRR